MGFEERWRLEVWLRSLSSGRKRQARKNDPTEKFLIRARKLHHSHHHYERPERHTTTPRVFEESSGKENVRLHPLGRQRYYSGDGDFNTTRRVLSTFGIEDIMIGSSESQKNESPQRERFDSGLVA